VLEEEDAVHRHRIGERFEQAAAQTLVCRRGYASRGDAARCEERHDLGARPVEHVERAGELGLRPAQRIDITALEQEAGVGALD
jgi:hypothetical protein